MKFNMHPTLEGYTLSARAGCRRRSNDRYRRNLTVARHIGLRTFLGQDTAPMRCGLRAWTKQQRFLRHQVPRLTSVEPSTSTAASEDSSATAIILCRVRV